MLRLKVVELSYLCLIMCACVCVHGCACVSGPQDPEGGVLELELKAMWVLGTKLGSSARAVCDLNH